MRAMTLLLLAVCGLGCVAEPPDERRTSAVQQEVVSELTAVPGAIEPKQCSFNVTYEVERQEAFVCEEWGPRPGCSDPTIPCPTVCARGSFQAKGGELRRVVDKTLVACRAGTDATAAAGSRR